MANLIASDLPVAIRLADSEAEYEVGILFEGAFHVIQKIKAGRIHREIRLAGERLQKAAAAAAAVPPPPPPPVA